DSEFECDVEGENGIEAGDESEVNIDAETCSIEGDIVENQKNVNTGECEEVNTEEENNEQENNDVNEFAVCEFECGSEGCALFCDGISNDCKSQCTNAPNISACIQECSGLECGEKKCHEFCLDETLKCDVKEECDEVCVSDLICESTDICLEKECLEFSPCELVCEGEGENEECHEVCSDDCLVFGECLKFKEECHCPEENFELVCEEFEVCEEECTEFGLACRFECEGIL
ncbi:MAG: hypothetical protein GTO02_12910, partial [Candidatus Dadabacteria bacterium]|nr:hypothetical protein [Candidatus Dadabacteria bacterium]NIQ15250.1 hypothetical protein [Candidatus Dadabacteria bacterium]